MIICKKCFRPNEGDKSCLFCKGETFTESKRDYSIKQWEYFIKSLSGSGSHDFSPYEFDEDGTINRGQGVTGSSGNVDYKSWKQIRRERRISERNQK